MALYNQEEDIFTSVTDEGNTILRSLYYPAFKDREVVPGAVRATLMKTLILCVADHINFFGLQLLTRDGEWIDVNAEPGEIVADSGDMLSRVTNGVLPAAHIV